MKEEIKIKLLSKQAREMTANYSLVRKKQMGGGAAGQFYSQTTIISLSLSLSAYLLKAKVFV